MPSLAAASSSPQEAHALLHDPPPAEHALDRHGRVHFALVHLLAHLARPRVHAHAQHVIDLHLLLVRLGVLWARRCVGVEMRHEHLQYHGPEHGAGCFDDFALVDIYVLYLLKLLCDDLLVRDD